uniref:hypothetical protein n=1 Tax=Olsenella timonensis TaxID=1805478 RepID=UPI00094F0000|nr:hypothetical protein [Olsenella timonensis]
MGQKMTPAVAAGLIGSATFVMPETAQALSLTELVDATFATPTAAFTAGAAGGAALTGIVAVTAALVVRARAHDADEVPVIPRHMRPAATLATRRPATRTSPRTTSGAPRSGRAWRAVPRALPRRCASAWARA